MRKRTSWILCAVIINVTLLCPALCEELLILSPHWDGIKKEFGGGFSQFYRRKTGNEVNLRWLDVGGTTDILRYITARSQSGDVDLGADVLFGGGLDPFFELKKRNLLLNYVPSVIHRGLIPQDLAGNRLYDSDGSWSAVMLSGFGIVYNRKVLERLGVECPKRFSDLADPSLEGWVGSADPRKSGSIRFIYELIFQYLGWEQGWKVAYGIAANARSFSSHSGQTPKDITSGEIGVGLLIDSYARQVQSKYGAVDIGFVIPEDVPALFGDGIAILSGAKNSEVAKAFVNFVLGEEGQRLLSKKVGSVGGPQRFELGKLSVLPSVYQEKDKLDFLKDPFMERDFKGKPYNFDLASTRWHVLTSLIGAILVDQAEGLRRLRRERPDVFKTLAPPITEEEVSKISQSGRWKDAAIRDRELGEIKKAFARKLPSEVGAFRWSWILIALLALPLFSLLKKIV